jgi:hypothetical protein
MRVTIPEELYLILNFVRTRNSMKFKPVFIAAILTLTLGIATTLRGQWEQTNGPYGGPLSGIASIGNILFATSAGFVLQMQRVYCTLIRLVLIFPSITEVHGL